MNVPLFFSKPSLRMLLLRAGIFFALFILISFFVGSLIVGGPLLYDLWFFVYGGLGYIVLAVGVFFVVLAREKLLVLPSPPKPTWWAGVLAILSFISFRYGAKYVNMHSGLLFSERILFACILHALFVAIFVLLALCLFSWSYIRAQAKNFQKELQLCAGVGIVFYAAMRVVWLSWEILSFGVSRVVYVLLHVFPGDVTLIEPQTLIVREFAVYIGEACSGVFSIFLFTCLYLLIVGLDWQKLRHGRVVLLFFVTVFGLFLVNVLRVYLIMLVGVYYDPYFAINLFHSYIGMVLFLLYFIGFLWTVYDWLKR